MGFRVLDWLVLTTVAVGSQHAVTTGSHYPLVPFVDHDALSREKLLVADHPVARRIAECYSLDVSRIAELQQHRG